MSQKKQKTWASTEIKSSNDDKCKWKDRVKMLELKKDYIQIRLIEAPTSAARYNVKFFSEKLKKESGFSMPAFSYNIDTEAFEDPKHCPAAKYTELKAQIFYSCNCIVRDLQENKPAKIKQETPNENGFRDINDDAWSPVRVVSFPATLAKKIKGTINLNKVKLKDKDGNIKTVTKGPDDDKYGYDIAIYYDKDADPASMYDAQMRDRTPLTEEEKAYLKYDLSIIPNYLNSKEVGDYYYESKKDFEKSLKRIGLIKTSKVELEDDEVVSDDSAYSSKKRKEKEIDFEEEEVVTKQTKKVDEDFEDTPSKPKTKKVEDDFEDEIEEEKPKAKKQLVVEDDVEEETPKSKKVVEEESDDWD